MANLTKDKWIDLILNNKGEYVGVIDGKERLSSTGDGYYGVVASNKLGTEISETKDISDKKSDVYRLELSNGSNSLKIVDINNLSKEYLLSLGTILSPISFVLLISPLFSLLF